MKKALNAVSKIVFSRSLIIILMVAAQAAVFPLLYIYLAKYAPYIIEISAAIATVFVVIVINKDEPAEFKLTWVVLLCVFPLLGLLFYIFVQSNWGMIGLRNKVNAELDSTKGKLYTSDGTKEAIKSERPEIQRFAYYMEDKCSYPIYHNTKVTYFPTGEEKIEDIKNELKKATKFIFIEYFIIDKGVVWDSILEILKEKAAQGVEVRVMYDGLCCLLLLPYQYPNELKKYGIKAKMFSPLVPFLSTNQNNRDHRKILVIDGEVAYTGGVNLADEYANLKERFGYWKDVGVKLEGRAVMSFSMMFMQMWNIYGDEDLEYDKYLVEHPSRALTTHDGFVIPYGDSPTSRYETGKVVYSDVFAQGMQYIHIMTPYFIIDREFLSVMKYAGERGVDVKIILPSIPDKKIAYWIARTFYPQLLSAGIKIYEFLPGFVHAKMMVSDDMIGTCGSVNLDYRSFYHHFECGVYLYNNSAVVDMEKDFINTLEKCREVTYEYYKQIPLYQRFFGHIFKLFAPLL